MHHWVLAPHSLELSILFPQPSPLHPEHSLGKPMVRKGMVSLSCSLTAAYTLPQIGQVPRPLHYALPLTRGQPQILS